MSNSKKLLIALVAMLTIGASAAFANWSGTGTGICTDGNDSFGPFATWEGSVQYDTTKIPWEITGFAGTWTDAINGESGTFSGTWVRLNPPEQVPGIYRSTGTWGRIVSGGTAEVEWGGYTITFTIPMPPLPGSCSGTWNTTFPGWYGNGTITGSTPGGI